MNRVLLYAALAIGLVIAGSVGALLFFAPAPKDATARLVKDPTSSRHDEAAMESLRDLVRKGADVESARGVIGQLNNHLSRLSEDQRQPTLSEAQRKQVEEAYFLNAEEIAELANGNYTLLDAWYLEACSLLYDAARSLRLEELAPVERAAAAFAWVVRNVRLRERPNDPREDQVSFPPVFVLRRGWGTELERALIFVSLLDQLGLDGCMIVVPVERQGEKSQQYWIPGALVDKEIYLFDTRMGIPLPGPHNNGIATFNQLRNQSEAITLLIPTPNTPYDVTSAQAKEALVFVACQLSGMAPRMQYLQDSLAGTERLVLYTDPLARLKRFHSALAEKAGSVLKTWSQPIDAGSPTRVLRSFLPVEEGGTDKFHRRETARRQLIPEAEFLPGKISNLPGDLGQRVAGLFRTPFVYFNSEPHMSSDLMKFWLPGLIEKPRRKDEDVKIPDIIVRGNMPRDLSLHGRFDEATNVLVILRDELKRQKAQLATPDLANVVSAWCDRAISVAADVIRMQREGGNAEALMNRLWAESKPVQTFVLGVAAEPMLSEVLYLLALTKHEQAIRMQARLDRVVQTGKPASAAEKQAARDAWKAAATWWSTYLSGESITPDAATARLHQAAAWEALGDKEKAINLYENVTDVRFSLEKTARLFLARRLRGQ